MHNGVAAVKLAEQLETQAQNAAQLNRVNIDLEKDLKCKEAAVQTALEEVKTR